MTTAPPEREELAAAGQQHVLDRLEALEGEARERLARQIADLDLPLLGKLHALTTEAQPPASRFDPPDVFPLRRSAEQAQHAAQAVERGQELLRTGKVGYVLVAGGQASRLGYDAPKGDFPIGPVTERTLFGYHAARLAASRARYGTSVPWYVMTSPANDAATREIFERNDHFGLPREDVFFFSQGMLPALDASGRVLFSARDQLFLAPNGHGGCLLGLASSGALQDMRRRGIEQLSYFQVDNPLVRPTDPLFLGLHDLAGAGMSSKVVAKRDTGEKVGVLGLMDGVLGCIEYSDLPDELREARDDGGELRFRAGNIAVHVLARTFVEEVTSGALELPWHVAKKSMQVVDADGHDTEVAGFKFETFVFDALARSRASVTLEVARELEFSPVKNKSGEDSPASSRAALCALFSAWVRAAGGELPAADAEGNHPVEVDPRWAETQDEFLAHGTTAPDVRPTGHLYA